MKFLFPLLVAAAACTAHADSQSLHCAPLNSSNKTLQFLVDVDRDRKIVLMDGHYTSEVSVSDFLISFVFADDKQSYSINIYPNGRLTATHAQTQTALMMQCS